LDASSATPPVLTSRVYEDGEVLPDGTLVDLVCIEFFTTNGDIDQFPAGVFWPPRNINPLGAFVVFTSITPFPVPVMPGAWTIMRRMTGVYSLLLTLPRTSLTGDPVFADVMQTWEKSPYLALCEILHHPPTAVAGNPRSLPVDYTRGGILTEDLVLDGSKSSSVDGDPLRYTWGFSYYPSSGAALPWNTASFAQETVLALPAGTQVPESALGNYLFSLNVTDADTGLAAGAIVEYSLVRLNHAPVAVVSLQVHFLAAGYTLREDMTLDGSRSYDPDGDQLSFSWSKEPGGTWPFTFGSANAVETLRAAGETVPPECVGSHGFLLTVRDPAGAVGSAIATQDIDIIKPELRFSADTPGFATMAQVLAGVTLFVVSQAPDDPNLVQPDSYELHILDQSGSPITTRPVSDSEIANGIVWDGTLRPDYALRLGTYGFQVVSLTQGLPLSATEVHELTVVTVNVAVTGLTETATGWQGPGAGGVTAATVAFPVKADGPLMPELTVNVELLGIVPDDNDQLSWDVRLEITYAHDGDSDVVAIPAQGWHSLAAGETTWSVTPDVFCGGNVKAYAQAVSGDVTLTGESTDAPDILGENPAKAQARAALGPLEVQLAAYEASQFTQFGGGPPSIFQTFLATPLLAGGRCGIGGIQNATLEQQWNWEANVTALSQLAAAARADALTYQAEVRDATLAGAILHGTPVAPEFTPEELDLETWARMQGLNTGYYRYDDTAYVWVRQPAGQSDDLDRALAYAERLGHLRAAVHAGSVPVHWDDQAGGAPPGAQAAPADQILDLCGSGQPLSDVIAAVVAILAPLGWWELWDTLDSLARPVPGAQVSVLNGIADTAAASPGLDARVCTALDIVVLRQGGFVIGEADLPLLLRIAEGLWTVPATQRLLLLEWLGLRGLAAEGIVAGGDAAAAPVAAVADGLFAPVPVFPFPFGDWKLPGKMPAAYYIGSQAHLAIGLEYEALHSSPAETVFLDMPVAEIVEVLARGLPVSPEKIEGALARARPDIIEWSNVHEIETIGDLFGYEIKPEGSADLAAKEWTWYQNAFNEASLQLLEGPSTLPGTAGLVAMPNGWAEYVSPAPGVIVYKYLRASTVAIKARDEERKRADTSVYAYQQGLEARGWGPIVAVVGALILIALSRMQGAAIEVEGLI
jgi:hypothetical protein